MKLIATHLSLLSLMIIASTSSHAVYNLYKKDGLTLDINGQVDMQATKQDIAMKLARDAYSLQALPNNNFDSMLMPVDSILADNDRRTRLGQDNGISYLDIRTSQQLPYDWRITGNIGLNYNNTKQLYLSNSSLSLDKKGLGAISFGRQYLHTGFVGRTGTSTPLDTFSSSSVRLDYTGIKDLHTSAYFSLPGSTDIRQAIPQQQTQGFGASASWRKALDNNKSVRLAAGVSHAQYNPPEPDNFLSNPLNLFPARTMGMAASAEYRMGKLLLATDIGHKTENMSKSLATPLKDRNTYYFGAKVAYSLTPVLQVSAGHGITRSKTSLKRNVAPLFNDKHTSIDDDNQYSFVNVSELALFDARHGNESYAQVDYFWRPNVRFYGRFDTEQVTNKISGADFNKYSDKNYRAGIVFTF